MSTGRVLWLIWCLAWAGTWFFVGFATLGIGWILAALSVAAFWLPVGKPGPLPQVLAEHERAELEYRRGLGR